MPPLCQVAPSPSQPVPTPLPLLSLLPLPPPPACEPFPPLSEVEEELFDIAIWLDCALREFDTQGGVVNISHFTKSIVKELVSNYMLRSKGYWCSGPYLLQNDVDKLSASYLRTHPIIEYLGGIIVQAAQCGAELDLFSLSLEVVERWCEEAEKHCPTEPSVIHMPDLSVLIKRIPEENQWWIPLNGLPTRLHSHRSGTNHLIAQQ